MENKAVHISKRILVADDDPDMVAFMTLPLRKRGYTITAGGNGEEALLVNLFSCFGRAPSSTPIAGGSGETRCCEA